MALGDLTLQLSLFLATLAAAAAILRVRGFRLDPRVDRLLSMGAGVLSAVTMFFLFRIFLDTDLDFEIVYRYSSTDLPWVYKLSGSWAGQAGSMVLWSSMVLMFWAVEEARWWRRERREGSLVKEEPEKRKRRHGRGRSREARTLRARQAQRRAEPVKTWRTLDVARATVMLLAVVLLLATDALDPFQPREDVREGAGPNDGWGLNPVLRTPLMAIHPPVVFAAYALVTLVLGAAVGYLATRDDRWLEIARPWGRLGWLMLTLGIGIGAMWAYVTLGWGGYWAWDPVETSSFIPWISLTALLHAMVGLHRRGDYRHLAPFLAGITQFLVLFATFVTRSGVWSSVHAYAGASEGNALDKVSEAISASPSLNILYWSMWGVLLLTVAATVWGYLRSKDDSPMLPARREGEDTLAWLARTSVSMFAAVFLLTMATFVVLLILVVSVDGDVSPGEYHGRLAAFAIGVMAILVVCMFARLLQPRRAAKAAVASLGVGVIAWVLNPAGLDPPVAWFGAGVGLFFVVAIAPAIWGASRRAVAERGRPMVIRFGSTILHMGLAMLFMAYCLSNVPTFPETTGTTPTDSVEVEAGDYSVLIEDRSWELNSGVEERGEDWDTCRGNLRLLRGGEEVASGEVEVTTRWQWRQYGTLHYVKGGESGTLDGEVVAQRSDPAAGKLMITVQSLRQDGGSVEVNILSAANVMTPWPALGNDKALLRGQLVRLASSSREWVGFLVDVEGPRGNVTLSVDGREVRVPGNEIQRSYRRAYVGLVMSDVFIHTVYWKDVYIIVHDAVPRMDGSFEAEVTVKDIPAMAFVWGGMGLMSLGLVLRPADRGDPSLLGDVVWSWRRRRRGEFGDNGNRETEVEGT